MVMNVRVLDMFCGSVLSKSTLRNDFVCRLQKLFGDRFEVLESLDSFEKAFFVFGCELWKDDCSSMLDLVEDYVVGV